MKILSDGLHGAVSFGGTARSMIVLMASVVLRGVLLMVLMRRRWYSRMIAAL